MTLLELGLAAAAVGLLILLYFRANKSRRYPACGLIGLLVIALAALLLLLNVNPVAACFTPIVWTGYIMAVDGAVFSVRGRSLLRSEPEALVWMAILSIFSSLMFEGYNLYLPNWTYIGLPSNVYLRYLLYGWMFATFLPAILETAEFLLATLWPRARKAADPPPPGKSAFAWMLLGLLMVTLPLLGPRDWGVAWFGLIWVGFVFVADPLNRRAGRPSLGADLAQGGRARLWALLLAGAIWGVLWEFWNYWAGAKRIYVAPLFEQWRIFEVPPHRLVEFSALAVSAYATYVFAASILDLPRYEIR